MIAPDMPPGPFVLDARSLTLAQRCARRWVLEATEPRGRWNAKSLFDANLRAGVLDLAGGASAGDAAREACTRFRQAATNPGLDTGSDPWTLTQDYCAALETILEAAGRTQVPQFGAMPPVALGDGATWAVRAFYTSAEGRLVRWASVDRTDDAAVARELHSWHVFGDMATTGLPLTLNLVELGTYRAGHRYSWWTRTFAHPAIPRQFKFRSRSGGALQGAWRGVWFRDSGLDPAEWVDLMARDGIRLVHTLEVQPISEAAREEFRRQVLLEAARLAALGSWTSVPMFRAACDWPGTCPWQHKCYAAR